MYTSFTGMANIMSCRRRTDLVYRGQIKGPKKPGPVGESLTPRPLYRLLYLGASIPIFSSPQSGLGWAPFPIPTFLLYHYLKEKWIWLAAANSSFREGRGSGLTEAGSSAGAGLVRADSSLALTSTLTALTLQSQPGGLGGPGSFSGTSRISTWEEPGAVG